MTFENYQKEYDLKFSSIENIKLGLKDPNTGTRMFAAKALSRKPLTQETLGLWEDLTNPELETDLAIRLHSIKYVTARPSQTKNIIIKLFLLETDVFLYQSAIINLNIFIRDFSKDLSIEDKKRVKEILDIRKNDFKDKKLLKLIKNLKKELDKNMNKD